MALSERKPLQNFLGHMKIHRNPFLRGFIKVIPLANAFFGATFSVSVAYLLRQTFAVETWVYSAYCSVTAAVSMIVPLIAIPVVKKFKPNQLFFSASPSIAGGILLIGIAAISGIYHLIPATVSIVLITIFDCLTIAAAIPMQMTSSIMLQTGVEKQILGRVSATLRMVSITSGALGEILFGVLNDGTWVWLPIFLGAAELPRPRFYFAKISFDRVLCPRVRIQAMMANFNHAFFTYEAKYQF